MIAAIVGTVLVVASAAILVDILDLVYGSKDKKKKKDKKPKKDSWKEKYDKLLEEHKDLENTMSWQRNYQTDCWRLEDEKQELTEKVKLLEIEVARIQKYVEKLNKCRNGLIDENKKFFDILQEATRETVAQDRRLLFTKIEFDAEAPDEG